MKNEVKDREQDIETDETKKFTATNDYVFKRLFGWKGNEKEARGLLKAVTKRKFEKIELGETTILDADLISGKVGILDVRVKTEYEDIDIEMQVASSKYIAERVLWYWSRMYGNSFEKGDSYKVTPKIRCILIADFNLELLKNMIEFHTEWKIIENKYREIVLTDKFHLDIIELNKLEQSTDEEDEELKSWCKFIKAPDEVGEAIMEKYPEIKEAKEKLDKINADENERRRALLRERALHDEATMREESYDNGYAAGINDGYANGITEGEKKGREEGLAEGRSKGEKSKSIEIAKKLLVKGMLIEEISAITELSEDEIRKIENEK